MGITLAPNPVSPVWGEASAGDDPVNMDMLAEVLAPSVQHQSDARDCTEMLGVGRKGFQRRGSRLEQQVVERPRIALGQGIEVMREGEDDVTNPLGADLDAWCLKAPAGCAPGKVRI